MSEWTARGDDRGQLLPLIIPPLLMAGALAWLVGCGGLMSYRSDA
jgi:hypothetical protein